jgi:ubiquinol-cytochrome c reductase cytochrome c subunit
MKYAGSLFAACALVALLISGCAKGGSEADSSATKGPITDTASNGLKQNPVAANAMGDAVHGKEMYAQNCASCHGVNAQGGMGPNLHHEKARKNYQATIAWIKNPQPPMTKLYPAPLSESDVADVAAYVQTL